MLKSERQICATNTVITIRYGKYGITINYYITVNTVLQYGNRSREFTKTVILLGLAGYELIITNSA